MGNFTPVQRALYDRLLGEGGLDEEQRLFGRMSPEAERLFADEIIPRVTPSYVARVLGDPVLTDIAMAKERIGYEDKKLKNE